QVMHRRSLSGFAAKMSLFGVKASDRMRIAEPRLPCNGFRMRDAFQELLGVTYIRRQIDNAGSDRVEAYGDTQALGSPQNGPHKTAEHSPEKAGGGSTQKT